jgi:DNA polymerase III subunit gamma/tau
LTPKAEGKATKQVAAGSQTGAEAYLVLARRYRPMQFDQVIGQQHVSRTLQNAIKADRVHHAYLFTGSRGVGKTTIARIMAKALNCEQQDQATPDPCDACPACEEIREGRSVDVFEIDGASHTGVDDVRELRQNVRYQPQRCRHKIYIIDEVHMLSTSAFNALLKTLEEPPPHVIFMFATTEPHKIPATILSRCQRFDLKRVPAPTLVEHLQHLCELEQVTVEQAGLALIARAAEGSVRDALSLLDQVIAYGATDEDGISASRVAEVLGVADRRVLFEFSAALLERDAQAALEVIDKLFANGQDLSQFARAFLNHLRDLTVVRTCQDPGPLVDATEAELTQLSQQAGGENAELVPQHFDHFARVTEEVARSAFPRLLLEMAAIEMVNAAPVLPLGDLLQRLEGLESKLGGGSARPRTPRGGGGGGGKLEVPDFTGAKRTSGAQPPGRQGRPAPAPAKAMPSPAKAAPARPPVKAAPAAGAALQQASQEEPAPPPPVPPPAPAATPAASPTNGQAMVQWQQLIKGVLEREPVAAAAFAAGKLISWADDKVQLGYPPDSFELQWAKDPQKLEAFVEECSRQAGRALQVTIREIQPEEAASPEMQKISAMEDQARRRRSRARALREEAEGHPVTRGFVENFGATIASISTEADE